MAQDISIDAIIRRNLAMRKLPLHYYSPMLVMAKRGLESMHFNTLQKVKVVVLPVDQELFTADLPVDYVEAVMVGVETGDKVRQIGYSDQLNTIDTDEAFIEDYDVYMHGAGYQVGVEDAYNEYLGYKGRLFGRPVTFIESYTIMRELDKIRIDHKSVITEIQLVYLCLPEKVSNMSVIHPFAQEALSSWIDWQWAKYTGAKDQELRRRDYFNDYRILRGMLNKMTTTEIKRIVRNKIQLSVKN